MTPLGQATTVGSASRGAGLALAAASLLLACTGGRDPDVVEVTSDDCATCHMPEFASATEPPHQGVLPPDCALCHTNTAWSPATFTHDDFFRTACALCHQADYDNTSTPVHAGMFPTTCVDCHGTRAWQPALQGTHPEASFPIGGGPHENIACTHCHDVYAGDSAGGMNTDCVGCHTGTHNMNKVNEQHHEVADYQFDASMPNFCLMCHPNGRK